MQPDLIGNYLHTLDAKGRLFLPAKQREKLGGKVYMTRGLDKCIFVFSEDEWGKFIEGLNGLALAKARPAVRFFGGNAACSEIDSQGRIAVPQGLRQISGIEKDVEVVGVFGRIELWDPKQWEEFNASVSDSMVSNILEELNF